MPSLGSHAADGTGSCANTTTWGLIPWWVKLFAMLLCIRTGGLLDRLVCRRIKLQGSGSVDRMAGLLAIQPAPPSGQQLPFSDSDSPENP